MSETKGNGGELLAALVTGASKGLGLDIARRLAADRGLHQAADHRHYGTSTAAPVRALRSADVTRIFTNEGADPVGNKPAEFAAIVKEETAKWAKVIKAAGIKPE